MADRIRYEHRTVPLAARPARLLAGLARRFSDEEYVGYEDAAGYRFALGAAAVVTVDRDTVRVSGAGPVTARVEQWAHSPYPVLERVLAELEIEDWRAYGTADFEFCHVGGPLHGTLGPRPLLRLMVPETEIVFDGAAARVRGADPGRLDAVAALLAGLDDAEPDRPATPVPVDRDGADAYRAAVRAAVSSIRAGELQKVILSRVVPLATDVDLPATYLEGRRNNDPARSFLLRIGGLEATGFSPEIVVSVDRGGRVTAQPLAGTRAMLADPAATARARADLLSDEKEIFEHAISVKAVHEEMAGLCGTESSVVEEFLEVKERGSVQHLGSRISGVLPQGRGPWDAFQALFPSITASGIPKSAAYQQIQAHEPGPRGLYSGAVLSVDHTGVLDAALVLRAVYRAEGRTWLRAGAGVVALSTPEREFEETCEKLQSVARYIVPVAMDGAPAPADDAERARMAEGIRAEVAGLLELEPEDVDVRENLTLQGITSLEIMTLAGRWNRDGDPVQYSDMLERPTIEDWTRLRAARH